MGNTRYEGDLDDLTRIQQQNLLGFRIRKLRTEQAHGDKVTLVDSESDVLARTQPMAIPMADLETNKQVVMKFDSEREYPDGRRELVYTSDEQPLPESTEDIIDALKRTLSQLEASTKIKRGKKRQKPAATFEVPAGYKLVPIEDKAPAAVSEAKLGTAVARDEEPAGEDKIDQLLEAILSC